MRLSKPKTLAALLLAGTIAGIGPAASADARPRLRAEVAVAADLVTIGDLFDHPGPLADRAIFRAPDLGTTGTVPAWRVVAEARAAGLADASEGLLVEVVVSRSAREIGPGEIMRLATAAVARQLGAAEESLQVSFDQPLEPRMADERSATPIRVAGVSLLPGNSRFEVLLVVDKGQTTERLKLRGQVVEVVEIVTLTRAVARGDVIRADDLAVERTPKRQAGAARSVVPAEIVGLAARRALRAGQPIAGSDFMQPLLVQRGETVTIAYEAPGLVLTARGQSLDQGALGDTVTVMNQQSKRTVVGVVRGPGRVVIGGGGTPVASLRRTQP